MTKHLQHYLTACRNRHIALSALSVMTESANLPSDASLSINVCCWLQQFVGAVEYCHKHSVAHR